MTHPARVIGVGASAGGVGALSEVVAAFPTDLDAAVLVVLHLPAGGYSVLPNILDRSSALPVAHAVDGEPLAAGQVYVAPPDVHLVVDERGIGLDPGPVEHLARPSIDRLFRSLAEACRARAIGVVLSGMLDDGTAGLQEIHRAGGVTLAQDPSDAVFPGMPRSAVRFAAPDHVLPLASIGPKLVELVASASQPAEGGDVVARSLGSR